MTTGNQSGSRAPGGVFADLHGAVAALVPEAGDVALPGESRADCRRCPLLPERMGPDHPWAFHEQTRCCTYHPDLPNFLAGEALARGGVSADRVRARLADTSGVSPWGIVPSDAYRALRAASTAGFGRDPALRCPFWVAGELSCGIWEARNSVCRTWFCRHDHGVVGIMRWTALRTAIGLAEKHLAEACIRAGTPPGAGANATDWEAWFVWCAEHAARLPAADLAALRDRDELAGARRRVVVSRSLPGPQLPDVVVPVVRSSVVTGRGIRLQGYSSYDSVEVAPSVLHFFVRLDGRCTWQNALAACRADLPDLNEAMVRELGRIDVLRPVARVLDEAREHGMIPVEPGALMPDILVPAMQKPIAAGGLVWLQGAVPLASVLAPPSIFGFLSRLDGHTPWRDALEQPAPETTAAQPAENPAARTAVTAELVARLHAIGALVAPDVAE